MQSASDFGVGLAHRSRPQISTAVRLGRPGSIGLVGRSTLGFAQIVASAGSARPTVGTHNFASLSLRPPRGVWSLWPTEDLEPKPAWTVSVLPSQRRVPAPAPAPAPAKPSVARRTPAPDRKVDSLRRLLERTGRLEPETVPPAPEATTSLSPVPESQVGDRQATTAGPTTAPGALARRSRPEPTVSHERIGEVLPDRPSGPARPRRDSPRGIESFRDALTARGMLASPGGGTAPQRRVDTGASVNARPAAVVAAPGVGSVDPGMPTRATSSDRSPGGRARSTPGRTVGRTPLHDASGEDSDPERAPSAGLIRRLPLSLRVEAPDRIDGRSVLSDRGRPSLGRFPMQVSADAEVARADIASVLEGSAPPANGPSVMRTLLPASVLPNPSTSRLPLTSPSQRSTAQDRPTTDAGSSPAPSGPADGLSAVGISMSVRRSLADLGSRHGVLHTGSDRRRPSSTISRALQRVSVPGPDRIEGSGVHRLDRPSTHGGAPLERPVSDRSPVAARVAASTEERTGPGRDQRFEHGDAPLGPGAPATGALALPRPGVVLARRTDRGAERAGSAGSPLARALAVLTPNDGASRRTGSTDRSPEASVGTIMSSGDRRPLANDDGPASSAAPVRPPTAVADGGNELASRFLAELGRAPMASGRPIPTPFEPLARAIAPAVDRVRISTDSRSRRALQRVGKRAATVGDTIHLAAPPQSGRATAEVLAHELTHVAHPSAVPRFFDDDVRGPEERLAERVASVIAKAPVSPGAPVPSRTQSSAPTIRRSVAPSPGSVGAEELVASLTGGSSSGRPQGSGAGPVLRSMTPAAVRSNADHNAGPTSSTGPDSAVDAADRRVTLADADYDDLVRRLERDLVRRLEERIDRDLVRRGGRRWRTPW
jgi:hypothetical protein